MIVWDRSNSIMEPRRWLGYKLQTEYSIVHMLYLLLECTRALIMETCHYNLSAGAQKHCARAHRHGAPHTHTSAQWLEKWKDEHWTLRLARGEDFKCCPEGRTLNSPWRWWLVSYTTTLTSLCTAELCRTLFSAHQHTDDVNN